VQGVRPARRGAGWLRPGWPRWSPRRCNVAPVVSLYVNDFNRKAWAAYRRVGFTEIASFASVLF
jgi:hypothetical protein